MKKAVVIGVLIVPEQFMCAIIAVLLSNFMATLTKVQRNEHIFYSTIPRELVHACGLRKGDHLFWTTNEVRQLIITLISETNYPDIYKRVKAGAEHNAGIKSSL